MDSLTMEDIVRVIVEKFKKWARVDGDNETLSPEELYNVAYKEFPTLTARADKQKIVTDIFNKMDFNNDKMVEFPEFMRFFALLTISFWDFSVK